MKMRDRAIADKILEYCGEIENILVRLNHSEEAFRKDKGLSAGAVFYVVKIGELSVHFSEDYKEAHKELPWRKIKDIHDVLLHEYHAASPKTIWETATEDIPALRAMLQQCVKD